MRLRLGFVDTAADRFVGQVLEGRYRITDRLAWGGMATVYAALDVRLDRKVAVKVPHGRFAEDRQFLARFIGEAKAAARLSHPHVVAVFDQGATTVPAPAASDAASDSPSGIEPQDDAG